MSIRNVLILAAILVVIALAGCSGASTGQIPTMPDQPQDMVSGPPGTGTGPVVTEMPDRDSQIRWSGLVEFEPNDSPDYAQGVEPFSYFDGSVDASSDQNDYYEIYVDTPGCIYARLAWDDPDAWVNLYLYNNDLVPVHYDNSDNPSPKQVYGWDLGSGAYFVRVKCQEGSSDYRIWFAASRNRHEPANDSIEGITGSEIFFLDTAYVSAIHDDEDPHDYLELDVDTQMETECLKVRLDWIGVNYPDFNLYIHADDYSILASSAGSAHPEVCYLLYPPAGSVYIHVEALGGPGVYEVVAESNPVFIPDPDIFVYILPEWPWPDPDDLSWILDGFDPYEMGAGGFEWPLQWILINPHPEPPDPEWDPGEFPQNPSFGF